MRNKRPLPARFSPPAAGRDAPAAGRRHYVGGRTTPVTSCVPGEAIPDPPVTAPHPGTDIRTLPRRLNTPALWRSLKYEAIYLHEIADGLTARRLIRDWIRFYNLERPHAALDGRTPAEAYRGETPVDMMDKPLRALPTSPQAQQQQEDCLKGILAA